MIREALVDVWRVAMNPWTGIVLIAVFIVATTAWFGYWHMREFWGMALVVLPGALWCAWRWHIGMWGEGEGRDA